MSDRKPRPGKFVWFQHVSADARKAQAFYGELLGWTVRPFSVGDLTFDMIFVGDTMIGDYAAPRGDDRRPAYWIASVSVEDVDAAAKAAVAHGGKVVEAPAEIRGVGRIARIADPQGAELCPFKNATGDPADEPATHGRFFWNELHTSDPPKALAFYETVLGFSHRALGMGPAGTYHVLSRGGVDRGGATGHLPGGVPPHWLPYVFVDDVDPTIARARKLGATISTGPEDIPGIGRFGVLADPTGARLAVMKPRPRET
ncbi:MAG TPA: VOC family protein [Haliangiales bacterium]|nr:VOC family protein [Haliangiales bacterium]